MRIYNALELKKGAKVEYNKLGTLIQPFQFVPEKEKMINGEHGILTG